MMRGFYGIIWCCDNSIGFATPWFESMITIQIDVTFVLGGVGRNPSGFGRFSEDTFFNNFLKIEKTFFLKEKRVGNIFLVD